MRTRGRRVIVPEVMIMTTAIVVAASTTTATTTIRRAIAFPSSPASSYCFASSSSSSMSGTSSSRPRPLPRTSHPIVRRRMRPPGATEAYDDNDDAATAATTDYVPPWSMPHLRDKSSTSYARFRQHVNPLARRYRMNANLPGGWPIAAYDDPTLPLFLDVGCGKGGFLLEMAGRGRGSGGEARRRGRRDVDDEDDGDDGGDDDVVDDDGVARGGAIAISQHPDETPSSSSHWRLPPSLNYLGLEIRPGVSQYAQSRVSRRGLDGAVSFVGCNANVDLDRILTLYRASSSVRTDDGSTTAMPVVSFVAIQFPDPHFKKAHAKRRVVTSELVTTLAKFVEEGGGVFLQSDVRAALEAMREKFVDGGDDDAVVGAGRRYFEEWTPPGYDDLKEYGMDNPLGVPTEREGSVLNRGLPVFRTLFRRNSVPFES